MIDSIYLNAIIEANKAGARGWQVIGAEMPDNVADDYRIRLTLIRPSLRSATQREWFDK